MFHWSDVTLSHKPTVSNVIWKKNLVAHNFTDLPIYHARLSYNLYNSCIVLMKKEDSEKSPTISVCRHSNVKTARPKKRLFPWPCADQSLPPCWPSGKASASRAEGPGFESRLWRDFFGVESYQWLKTLVLQWLPCQAPGVIGSALGLVGPVSVYCVTGWDGKFDLQLLSQCGST